MPGHRSHAVPSRRDEDRTALKEFQYLGGNRARVTYEWKVTEPLDRDYQCFVHAVHPAATDKADHIVFQQDHALPKPTSQWRAGDVIIDGPHEITVSDRFDTYDLTTGLFRGERLQLEGLRDESNRIVIARLHVQRDGQEIKGLTVEQPATALLPDSRSEADFTAHMNPRGSWIDFGSVATDGSVKINKAADRLVVFPYPRQAKFTAALDMNVLAQEWPEIRSASACCRPVINASWHRLSQRGRING